MSVIRFNIDSRTGVRVPEEGCPVYTADSAWLGTVAAVRGTYLKIDAPLSRDYWLNAEEIAGEFSDGVSVRFNEAEAESHGVEESAVPAREDELSGIVADIGMSPVEQMEQRERMAKELAEQRAELPHIHTGREDTPPDTGGTLGEPVEAELARIEGQPVADVVREAAAGDDEAFGHTGARIRRSDEPKPSPGRSPREDDSGDAMGSRSATSDATYGGGTHDQGIGRRAIAAIAAVVLAVVAVGAWRKRAV